MLPGIGYHFTIVRNAKCKSKRLTRIIRQYVPDSRLESKYGNELSFILPSEQVHCFEALFLYLEQNRKDLGINSYGVSVTTMEEVFIR